MPRWHNKSIMKIKYWNKQFCALQFWHRVLNNTTWMQCLTFWILYSKNLELMKGFVLLIRLINWLEGVSHGSWWPWKHPIRVNELTGRSRHRNTLILLPSIICFRWGNHCTDGSCNFKNPITEELLLWNPPVNQNKVFQRVMSS